jgi:hypothetical protein
VGVTSARLIIEGSVGYEPASDHGIHSRSRPLQSIERLILAQGALPARHDIDA